MNEIEKIFRQNAERERVAFDTFKKAARPFEPMARPKSYRKRANNECFYNSAMLTIEKRGRYVEGCAQSIAGIMVHHAWITLDGVHAIETTWKEPGASYLGIEVDSVTLAKSMLGGTVTAQFELPGILQLKVTP